MSSHMTHTFFTFSAHAVLGKPRWTQNLLIHKTNYSVTMNMKRWRGEACWLWSEEQRHRVIWLLARFQLPELNIAAKFRTSFTPWVSRRCRVKPALSSTRRSQLKGSRLAAPRTYSLGTRLSLAQRIGAAEHVDLFFCRIHITHFFFSNKRVSASVLRCVFVEKWGRRWNWVDWLDRI